MATPTYKSQTTTTADTGTAMSLVTPNIGDGAASGDFGILILSAATGSVSSADPTGWVPITGSPTSATASAGRLYAWTKALYGASDLGSTVSWTMSGSSRIAAACITTSAAILASSAVDQSTNVAGTAVTAPSVTPGTASDLLVVVHGVIGNISGDQPTWTADALTTEHIDISSTSASARNATLLVAIQTLASAAATGTRIATSSVNVQRRGAALSLSSPVAATKPPIIVSQYAALY